MNKYKTRLMVTYLFVGSGLTTLLINMLMPDMSITMTLWAFLLTLIGPLIAFYLLTLNYPLVYLLPILLFGLVPTGLYYFWFTKHDGKALLIAATITWVLLGALNVFSIISGSV